MKKMVFILVALILTSGCALKAPDYATAGPQAEIQLPRDHFSHENFRTEWWYYSGFLSDEDGGTYGYHVAFFKRMTDTDRRYGIPIKLYSNPAHFAHISLTDCSTGEVYREEKRAADFWKKGGKAGARGDMLMVWNHEWSLTGYDGKHILNMPMEEHSLKLLLTPMKPFVVHGSDGFFVKSEGGNASYYIANTRLWTEGLITLNGKTKRVKGLSWMDHEYGSHMLGYDQAGWDWFSIQLSNGFDLMLYLMRKTDGTYDPHSAGSLIDPDGGVTHIGFSDLVIQKKRFWKSSKTKAEYPVEWDIVLPRYGIELAIDSIGESHELQNKKTSRSPYWEGAVKVTGMQNGDTVKGRGFVELTGYAKPLGYLTDKKAVPMQTEAEEE